MLRAAVEWARGEQSFVASVLAGLDIGRQRYGDLDYQGRDNAEGGLFEARDLAAYSLMEWSDMDNDLAAGVHRETIDQARRCLGEAIKAAATADQMLRLSRKFREEGRRDCRLPPLRRQTKGTAP